MVGECCKTRTGLDWICKTWTGFVKLGFVKSGFVKHGFVKHGLVKHGFVKCGFVKSGFVKHGFVKVRKSNWKSKQNKTTYLFDFYVTVYQFSAPLSHRPLLSYLRFVFLLHLFILPHFVC